MWELWYIMNDTRQDHQTFLSKRLPEYVRRFGQPATVVYCNPDDVDALDGAALGVRVVAAKRVQAGCFQITYNEQQEVKDEDTT
jgi:hypothetical protein